MPARSLGYVLLVDLAAVAVAGLSMIGAQRASAGQVMWLGLLLVGMLVHTELMKRVERLRGAAAPDAKLDATDSLWIVAGLLLLPFPLVVVLIAVFHFHRRLRVLRKTPPYRVVFSSAGYVLASAAGAAVLAFGGVDPAHLAQDAGQVGWLVVAIVLRDGVGAAVIVPPILMQRPAAALRSLLGTRAEHAFEIGSGVFGAMLAVVVVTAPALIPLLVAQIGILGYASRVPTFEKLAQLDGKTGLLSPTYWHELAEREFARARRLRQPVGILMIDIDHFKRINDRLGHLAGDAVLHSVATAITNNLGHEGLAGRFGGEEFVAFLRNVSDGQLGATAERLRRAVADLTVRAARLHDPAAPAALTISIGGCWSIHSGETFTDVLLAADSALFAAKNAGRNRIQLAPMRN